MNWRRGILLAAINLAVAIPLVLLAEAGDKAYLRVSSVGAEAKMILVGAPTQATELNDQVVPSWICSGLTDYPHEEDILRLTNMPAFVLAGWRMVCPPSWSLSGIMKVKKWGEPTPAWAAAERKTDIGFLLFIALQWILVGGLPFRNAPRWWLEPGMFITLCAVISLALFLVPPDQLLSRFCAIFAFFAWLWWFALLVWKLAHSGWKWTTRRMARAAT
jgi:hypothetical protein